ncbi:MAG TPA: integrase core domain-containing protein [Gemmatimonadales bacterium]
MTYWSERTELPQQDFISWLAIARSQYCDWRERYGKANEHNGRVPRDFWLEEWEKEAILGFQEEYPLEGYRRLTFMMLDRDVVAVSPSSVYRVLRAAGRLGCQKGAPSSKGKGFVQPTRPHEHWHVDISHLNICGTFYDLCSILDGYSRAIVHWEIQGSMTEAEVELVIQRGKEKYPGQKTRIITDNGPQSIARDSKTFVREVGLEHVRTSPSYPQSNGKKERFYQTLKGECIRPQTPLSLEDARRVVGRFVEYYNEVRLHSALGYVAPHDMLAGRAAEIHAERDRKLEAARERRRERRAALAAAAA